MSPGQANSSSCLQYLTRRHAFGAEELKRLGEQTLGVHGLHFEALRLQIEAQQLLILLFEEDFVEDSAAGTFRPSMSQTSHRASSTEAPRLAVILLGNLVV